jgi:hypothetical protein
MRAKRIRHDRNVYGMSDRQDEVYHGVVVRSQRFTMAVNVVYLQISAYEKTGWR